MIRLAVPADLLEITRIYNESIVDRNATADTAPRTLEDRRTWFQQFNEQFPLFVIEQEGRVSGYGGLAQYSPRDGYRLAAENFVYIGREARGKGLGRILLQHVLLQAESLGFRYLLARIFSHNEPSLKLHARHGFQVLGIQRQIIIMDDHWYDVTLMDRQMSP